MKKERKSARQDTDKNRLSPETSRSESLGRDSGRPDERGQFTEVKNAHASGIGSMGRNDEKLEDSTGGRSEDSGREEVY